VKYGTAIRYFTIGPVFEVWSDEKRQFYGETEAVVWAGRTWITEGTSTEVHGRRVRKIAGSDCYLRHVSVSLSVRPHGTVMNMNFISKL
jgi:hypothetical protein